jgi:membrane protein
VKDDAVNVAAQMSFFFVLSLFPFLLMVTGLLGWIPMSANWELFAHWLSQYFPTRTQQTMLVIMLHLSEGSGGFFSFGLVLAVWSASTGFLSLMEALTRAYAMRERRSYMRRRAIALSATFLAAFFLIACFAFWSAGRVLVTFLASDLSHGPLINWEWAFLRWLATLLILVLAVDLVHYFLPPAHKRWIWITPGRTLSVVCLSFISALFNLYVNHTPEFSRVYGALTGFIVMMLWIYLASLSLLVGAEIDAALDEARVGRGEARLIPAGK